MSNKTINIGLIVFGVIMCVVFLTADITGLGDGGGVGWVQWVGGFIGFIIAVVGVWLKLRGSDD